MKPLEKSEIYEHLNEFLKGKGIELKEGSYSQGIQKSCSLLTEAINLGQRGFDKAKREIDAKLDQMRQVIHEKTAPKPPVPPPPLPAAVAPVAKATPKPASKPKRTHRRRSSGRRRHA